MKRTRSCKVKRRRKDHKDDLQGWNYVRAWNEENTLSQGRAEEERSQGRPARMEICKGME